MIKYLRYKLWKWIIQHKKGIKVGDTFTDPYGTGYKVVDCGNDDDGSFIDLEDD
ncbi:MAG: hypothetical protein V3T40_01000 [Nitrososphaerales archaeon]